MRRTWSEAETIVGQPYPGGRPRRDRVDHRDRRRAADRLVPAPRGPPRRQDRHVLGRPDHLLGPDLRARPYVVLVSRQQVPDAPGEEDLDGPPIHGNTKLEVIWTSCRRAADRAVRLRLHRPARHREGARQAAKELPRPCHRPAVHLDLRVHAAADGKKFTSTQLYVPEGRSVSSTSRQGRPARLLGAGLADEDRRRARDHHALPRHPRRPQG